jgi:predicted neuraminidase
MAAIPSSTTNASAVRTELTTELGRIDTSISSRASQVSVSSIPTNPVLTSDSRLNNLDTTISSRTTGTVSANVVQINGTSITGSGSTDNKWRPA